MTIIKLGLNLNCLTNRFTEPEEWTKVCQDLGVHDVQYNADLLDPLLPWSIQKRVIHRTLELCEKRNIKIHSSFGGHNHHQHYFGHPDDEIAKWYEGFYRRLIRQSALLGARGVGTCYAIMSVKDSNSEIQKRKILHRAAQAYIRLAEYAERQGLDHLLFETTSVPRETCATFQETDLVLSLVRDAKIPLQVCLDVGHRNMEDIKQPESDPYEWIRRYGNRAPVIHLQQSDSRASRHWPFTKEFNSLGEIRPEKVISAVHKSGAKECLLAMEITHKAFYPDEVRIVENLRNSLEYWRSALP
ncbi:sugar phosphate isomerase/epimerase [Gammaproteobacteria bacterium]|nr:sugar phosphate isomerase/epimerase [Gammaproteobacteria bacterium]